jgi:hypothetical protein
VARDATARLYDVDADSFVFKKFHKTEKYDIGTISFQAKPGGKWIDLEKLHESVWATRLSGGTRSGVISLEVTAQGEVEAAGTETRFNVTGTDRQFILVDTISSQPEDAKASAFASMCDAIARGDRIEKVTGYVEGWNGRWPEVLRNPPVRVPKLMVTEFSIASEGPSETQK